MHFDYIWLKNINANINVNTNMKINANINDDINAAIEERDTSLRDC